MINFGTKIKKTIYLIRHGETDFNKNGIIQGSGIDSDLNDLGKKQANNFFEFYKHIKFDNIYISELKRTFQSIENFIENGNSYTILPELNEINWGVMEGALSNSENKKQYNKVVDLWTKGVLDIAIKDGETPLELFYRQKKGLDKIMSQKDEETILICMHGRAMRSFLCLLTNTPLKDMEQWQHSNLCLYLLNYNGKSFSPKLYNSIEHLK